MAGRFSTRNRGGVWCGALALLALCGSPALAQSFDCSRASPPIETAICASADLRGQDNALAGAYSRALFALRDDGERLDALKAAQRKWIADRNRTCGADPVKIGACLASAYASRLATIAQLVAAAPAPATVQTTPIAQPPAVPPVAPPQQAQPAPPPPVQAAQTPRPVQPPQPQHPAISVPVQPASVPADKDASALVTIPTPGRYAIRAKSATGVAIQLVDMIAGPGVVAGAAGVRDGRLDLLLDRGVYKIRTSGAKGATGAAALNAEAFREMAPPTNLSAGVAQNGDLGDLQQRSYWIDVEQDGAVALEALGRALSDLRMWRNGEELADLSPDLSTIETKAGRPMTRARLEGKVEPGRYLVTAYGGESAVWPDGGADHPFMIRELVAASLAAGLVESAIGPFGSMRFAAPAAMDAFRIETAQPAPLRLAVRRGGATSGAAIARNSRDPFVAAQLAANGKDAASVEVSGFEGQAFRLRAMHASSDQRIAGAGPMQVFVDVAGEGGDEIPATALLARFDAAGKSRILASDAPRIGAGMAWRGRFNLRGASTLLFEMTSPGSVAIRMQGPAARVIIEPILGSTPPRADGTAPSVWNLEAGVYLLRLNPVNGAAGLLDLTFGQPGQAPYLVPPPAPRSAISFGQQQIERGISYQVVVNTAPGLMTGVRSVGSPVDLSKGPAALWQELAVAAPAPGIAPQPVPSPPPAPVPQKQGAAPPKPPVKPAVAPAGPSPRPAPVKTAAPVAPQPAPPPPPKPVALQPAPAPATPPSGDIQIKVRAPLGGTILVRDQRGADVAFSVSDEQAAKDSRSFVLRVPAVGSPRALAISWQAEPRPQPPVSQGARQLETIASGTPRYFDLAEGQRREFRIEAKDGGLYRVETLGRLNTSLAIGTNFLPRIGEGSDNGAGHNALVQSYLRAGAYRVAVSAKDSTGRAGIVATPATMRETGVLSSGGSVRATLADGRGAIAPIDIRESGDYRLDLYGLGRDFSARLEDAEGWPLTQPGPITRLDLKLEAGRYRLVVPPVDVDARMVARLRPTIAPPVREGHGPHALPFGEDAKLQWREPPAKDAARAPDVWTFALAGDAVIDLSVTEGMIGEIMRGEKESVGKFTANRPFSGKLGQGTYRVETRAIGRDDRLDYVLSLSSDELQPDTPRFVDLPAKIDFAISEDRVVSLTTFGRKDLKGVLRDANGAIVERIGGRADDWNIALSRRLTAGRYTLSLSAMTADPTPADDTSADDQPDDNGQADNGQADNSDASADKPDAPVDESGVEVRLALPKEADLGLLALDLGQSVAGPQAARFALPDFADGSLAIVAARSLAELVLSIETRDAADALWRVAGFERGQSPVVAWPAGAPGKAQWRATVWSIDGASAPIAIVARAAVRQLQASEAVALEPLPAVASDGVAAKLRIGLARAPASAIVDLATAGADLYVGSSAGHVLARVDAGPLAPQSERLWFLSRDEDAHAVKAPALAWRGGEVALALDAGERAMLPVPAVPVGKARVWRARSAFGQPGLDAGHGMAVGDNLAIALDAGKSLRIWNAGGGDPMRVDLDSIDLVVNPAQSAGAQFVALLPPHSAQPLTLQGDDKTIEFDLAPHVAALSAPGETSGIGVIANESALARTIGGAVKEVWLVNLDDKPQPARVSVSPGKPEAVTASRVSKRFYGAGGSALLRVEASAGDLLRIEGADATFSSASGRVLRGNALTLDGPGDIALDYKPGLVAAWLERAGTSPWPKADARAVVAPSSIKLEGASMAFALKNDQPVLLGVRTSAPVAVALEQNGRRELKLYASGADFHRYLAAGDAILSVYSPHDGPLGGGMDIVATPIAPAKDGVGDPVALAPGASALFCFEVKRAAEIGVGLRAEPDRIEARLLDATGKVVGEGVSQIRRLDPGRYVIEARVPADAPATVVRPAIVGLNPPPAGPPPEEVEKYLAKAGLKSNDKVR